MDLYLRSFCKAGKAVAAKAAANSLNVEKKCGASPQKHPVPEIGVAHLLDLPLGVKLPAFPGSTNVFYTTNISEKLYQPSFHFNLTDPYCRLLETTYKSLHDPHLKTYYQRKDMLRRLRKGGFITSNNRVICSLSEFNKYRQYLSSLKIDFEREYVRQHRIIKIHVNKLHEGRKVYDNCDAAKFQEWLLQKGTQTTPEQELVIKRRYLDMISKEVDKIGHTTENQNMLQMKKEEGLYEDHIRRKLNLHGKIKEEWKNKEMLLMTKIAEEAKRDAKVEEQRRKIREGIAQKKQAYLEKKIAYHLQKMQRNYHKEESKKITFENKGQDERAFIPPVKKRSDTANDRETQRGPQEPKRSIHVPKSNNTISAKKLPTSLPSKQDVQNNATDQKNDKEITRTSDPLKNTGIKSAFIHFEVVASKTSVPRQSLLDNPEQATKQTSFIPDADRTKKVICADLHGKKTKKSSNSQESGQKARGVKYQKTHRDHWGPLAACCMTQNREKKESRCLRMQRTNRKETVPELVEKLGLRKTTDLLLTSLSRKAKPHITKGELLKDIQKKKDHVIRLGASDVDQKESENEIRARYNSDKDKIVLEEVVKEGFPESTFKDPGRKDTKHIADMLTFPKPPVSKTTLDSLLSLSRCCYPESSTAKSTETIRSQWTESEETRLRRILSGVHVYPSKSTTCTDSSLANGTRSSVEEMRSTTKPQHFFSHQIMSFSSYDEEDLSSYFSSDEDDRLSDPSAKLTEESLTDLDSEPSSVKFLTLFQRESVLNNAHSSNDNLSVGSQTVTTAPPDEVLK